MSKLNKRNLGIILFLAFCVASSFISPPDTISKITIFLEILILFGVFIFILYRFKPLKQASPNIKLIIVVMASLLSITTIFSIQLFQYNYHLNTRLDNYKNNQVDQSEEIDVIEVQN